MYSVDSEGKSVVAGRFIGTFTLILVVFLAVCFEIGCWGVILPGWLVKLPLP